MCGEGALVRPLTFKVRIIAFEERLGNVVEHNKSASGGSADDYG